MALPANKIKKITTPNNTTYEIIPERLGNNGYKADLPTLTEDSVIALTSNTISNPMTAQGDIIVGGTSGAASRLALGTSGNLLSSNGTTLAYTNALPIITTAPSSANTDGVIICVLSSEPATYYNGYLYIITGE